MFATTHNTSLFCLVRVSWPMQHRILDKISYCVMTPALHSRLHLCTDTHLHGDAVIITTQTLIIKKLPVFLSTSSYYLF